MAGGYKTYWICLLLWIQGVWLHIGGAELRKRIDDAERDRTFGAADVPIYTLSCLLMVMINFVGTYLNFFMYSNFRNY